MKNLRFSRTEFFTLTALFLLAIVIRFFVIKNNAIFFFFDQSRDATAAYQITHGHPIKVQGPSASGTSDSVYHGVLYYYLIAPAYALGHGNPFYASLWLGIVTSFTIFPIFLLGKSLSKSSQVGYLAAGLFAVSFEAAQMGTWLSNPGFAVLTLTCFYLFVWRVFYEKHTNELPWLALFLGLSNQSIIYSAYLFIILGLLYFFNQNKQVGQEPIKLTLKQIIISAAVYVVTIGSMLANQALLYKNGLFNPFKTLVGVNDLGKMPLLQMLQEIFNLFQKNIQYVFFPSSIVLSLMVCIAFFMLLKKYPGMVRQFLLIWFLAPLALLLFVFRNGYHVMIGSTPALCLVIALAIYKIQEMKLGKIVAVGILCLMLATQFSAGKQMLKMNQHLAGLQVGTFLRNDLELIDKTYQIAEGKPFSISTLTVPYGYNTTWAYLYHWYGQQKYGYLPSYVGSTQAGIYGSEFLTEKADTEKIHFSIIEPTQAIPQYFIDKFGGDQVSAAGEVSHDEPFGTLQLQVRDKGKVVPSPTPVPAKK